MSIAVGLAAFACVLLVVLFIMINKYGRRSKFGMKGKGALHWPGSHGGGGGGVWLSSMLFPLPRLSEGGPLLFPEGASSCLHRYCVGNDGLNAALGSVGTQLGAHGFAGTAGGCTRVIWEESCICGPMRGLVSFHYRRADGLVV